MSPFCALPHPNENLRASIHTVRRLHVITPNRQIPSKIIYLKPFFTLFFSVNGFMCGACAVLPPEIANHTFSTASEQFYRYISTL